MIVDRQEEEGWGRSVVEQLSRDLQAELPGVQGLSASSLWYMRRFYLAYRSKAKLQPLVEEIGWSHNLVILERCKDDQQREFYLRMTRRMGWTRRVLVHQIENQTCKSKDETIVEYALRESNKPIGVASPSRRRPGIIS